MWVVERFALMAVGALLLSLEVVFRIDVSSYFQRLVKFPMHENATIG